MFEVLESRRLMSAAVSGGILTVIGTGASETLAISQFDASTIKVQDGPVVLFFADSQVNSIRVSGLGGNDAITVGPNVNEPATLDGGDGNDFIDGGDASDTLLGGNGTDTLAGDAGNDTMDGGTGNDTMIGGAGVDTATYASRILSVSVSLDGSANDGQAGEGDNVNSSTENVIGGTAADTISGANGVASRFDGRGGNDRIFGFSASDTLIGGDGDDQIFGNGGNDVIQGGNGNDLLSGGAGSDNIQGGVGDDILIGGSGRDFLFGQDGNDRLFAQGDQSLPGFNDILDGGLGSDLAERDGLDSSVSCETFLIS